MIKTIEESFESAIINENSITFPELISQKTYNKIKRMLTDIRGEYVSLLRGFKFPFNPTNIINSYLVDGQWPRKNPYALFPTPAPIIEYALEYTHAGANRWTGNELVRILEPQAGRGDFIDAVVKDFNRLNIPVEVVCAELDPINIEILLNKGYRVVEGDFLQANISDLGKFDIIITNPPFMRETYIKHINHARHFMKPYGTMIAVIPTSLFSSNSVKASKLKSVIAGCNVGEFDDCIFDQGVFKNTDVETMLVEICSVEKFESQLNDLREYAANQLYIYAKNDFRIYSKFCQCATPDEFSALIPELVNLYLIEMPYSFVDELVIGKVEQSLIESNSEFATKSSATAVIPDARTIHNNEENEIISNCLNEISSCQEAIAIKLCEHNDHVNKYTQRVQVKECAPPAPQRQLDFFDFLL